MRKLIVVLCLCATIAVAQTETTTPSPAAGQGQDPTMKVEQTDTPVVFRVNVVQRTTQAVNYRHRGGETEIDFRGTQLAPQARGDAEVESKGGRLEIRADFNRLNAARKYGPEFLTYVLWAITPEGRAMNLGEVITNNDGNGQMRVTTDLQAFGMIVTAEPYFAVTRPSNVVVLENVPRYETEGFHQRIDARFDLLERGEYTVDLPAQQLPATMASPATDANLLQARNAVAIARASGAQQYAPTVLAKAEDMLKRAEDYLLRKQGRTPIGTAARGAVQAAEDARILTIRRKEEERIARERREAQEREDKAKADAEAARQRAEQARLEANEEARRRAEADAQRLAAEQAKAEAERMKAEAEAATAIARQERLAAEQARAQLAQEAERSRLAAEQAVQEKEQLRVRLQTQLNQVLQTRDSARGLIVNMSDVLFDTGKATLRPGARERLSRVAGIILAYPDLNLEVEGHTDAVGGEEYNQQLSDRRASAVRTYLVQQGVTPDSISALGLGESTPVADNRTAAGRQQNRRVELIVSGEAIGRIQGTAQAPTTPAGAAAEPRPQTSTLPGGQQQQPTNSAPVVPPPQ